MTIIPTITDPLEGFSAVRLARYAQVLGISECYFFGVNNSAAVTSCRVIWTLQQRNMVAKYLAEAQIEIENIVGYPVGKRWITELKRAYQCPALAQYAYVIQGGIMAVSDISLGEAVDNTTDPAIIGPIASTVTNDEEVKIYHPGTDIEIDPSAITISGGFITISIPRCRLVKVSLADNPDAGLSYSNLANFDATVDVKRVYNDPSTNAVLTSNHNCTLSCSSCGCSDHTTTGCIYVTDPEVGAVEVHKAIYANGAWSRSIGGNLCCNYDYMQLNYQAGKALDYQMEDAIIRLAHSKMPVEPCGCDPAKNVWKRDREVPEVLTSERLNNPLGTAAGSWTAYKFALSMQVWRSGVAA